MNIHEIYGVLFAGKTIKLHFASLTEAESFRIRLHKYKRAQEQVLIAADLLGDEEVTRLSFSLQKEFLEVNGSLLEATVAFIAKKKEITYTVVVMPDETELLDEEEYARAGS